LTEDDAYSDCKGRSVGRELKDERLGGLRDRESRGEKRDRFGNLVEVVGGRVLAAIVVSPATSMQAALDTKTALDTNNHDGQHRRHVGKRLHHRRYSEGSTIATHQLRARPNGLRRCKGAGGSSGTGAG
jgi:hypothetical protein